MEYKKHELSNYWFPDKIDGEHAISLCPEHLENVWAGCKRQLDDTAWTGKNSHKEGDST